MALSYAAFATFPDRVTAHEAIADVADLGLAQAKIKLFECTSDDARQRILDGLMSNGTWAESDVRRGLKIGISIGATLGCIGGSVLWGVLGMSNVVGAGLGAVMGTGVGAIMSGIVGSGLVNPRLMAFVRKLEVGQALVSISSGSEQEHSLAIRLLQTGSLDVGTDRERS